MKSIFGNIPSWINQRRKWVVGTYVVLVIAAFGGASNIRFDDSLESWFEQGSPIIADKQQFERHFGSNEDLYMVYAAKDGDIFSPQSLSALKTLHDKLQSYRQVIDDNPDSALTNIRSVSSLINENVTDVKGDALTIRPFIGNQLPRTAQEYKELRQQALSNPDFKLKYVSADGAYGGIVIKTRFGANSSIAAEDNIDDQLLSVSFDDDLLITAEENATTAQAQTRDYVEYTRFMAEVRELVSAAQVETDIEVFYTGLPELINYQVIVQQEMGAIFLGLFALIFILCFVLFKHFSAPIWTLTVIIATLILSLGAIGFTGMPLSSLSQAMLLLIILISVADVVHILSSYRLQRAKYDHETAMSLAYSKAAFSCLLTTVTTIAGFASLWLIKPSVPVANFGLMAVIGLSVTFLVAITLLPMLMDLWKLPAPKASAMKSTRIHPIYTAIVDLVSRLPRTVLACVFTVVFVSGMGALNLKVDTNNLESFDESTEIRQSFELADKHMGGTQNIDMMLDFGQVDAVYDGEVLKRIDLAQQQMHANFPHLIVTSMSIVNVLKQINQQLHQNDPAYYRLPESNSAISQLLFLFNNVSPEERKKLIAEDFDATRISFSLKNAGSSEYVAVVDSAEQIGAQYFGDISVTYPDVNISNTGGLVAFVTLFDKVTYSQILSFLVTLLVIIATLMLVFRSLYLGMLAMIPSVTPVIVTFGAMGWLGIALDSVTMVIAPIILGIAVDDSIHFIRKLQVIRAEESDIKVALEKVLKEVGSALVFTSVVLAGGLLTMMLSSNASFQHFGYLSAIAIFTALLADLIVIPAICMLPKQKQAAAIGQLSEAA